MPRGNAAGRSQKPRRVFGLWRDERGQSFVIVALLLTALLGFVGIVIDVGWYEVNLIRVQRAADAAALAGVVYLPGNVSGGRSAALSEATKNGYTNGAPGIIVTADPDPINTKIMNTQVTAPVRTYFSRLFGVTSFTASRRARAEFILPVPMGSPQDYYGIYHLCQTGGSCVAVHAAPNAGTGPVLASQGFWGAVITKGGQRSNGDAYSPAFNGGTSPNAGYDPNGYSYSVDFGPGTANGEVWLFDPTFCAVGRGSTGSYLGTGDHWIGTGGLPVTTEYRLWDTNGTPYATSDDNLLASQTFAAENQVDKGATYRGDQRYSDGGYNGSGSSNCQGDPYHNNWFRLGIGMVEGQYRLQVTTSSASNDGTSAENMFGIHVKSNTGVGGRVYGQSRMAAYANVNAGASLFYLAQVDAVHAGKTLEIRLFDPGDVGGTATLRIKKPTPTGYVNTTFSYTANGGAGSQSGTNVSSLLTANSGASQYQNAWVTITVPLPANYGVGGLTPPGETEAGWWKIEYSITSAGNDTTTWEVNIRGNPVHLVIP
ncbi:MAG: pilus assembly protein TadG-related protein [Candidatus Limnocylindria bacterium]